MRKILFAALGLALAFAVSAQKSSSRSTSLFNSNWKFHLGEVAYADQPAFDDSLWRTLDLPHDWSIEGAFSEQNPAGVGGGALPGGVGWYRKTFTLPVNEKGKKQFIRFDGVYRNSEVFINGKSLGVRPNGYISFEYDISQYVKFGDEKNVIAVKVDNSKQPNSRWYSGSGIYRNVWLTSVNKVYVPYSGTFIQTPAVNAQAAVVSSEVLLKNETEAVQQVQIVTEIISSNGKVAASAVAAQRVKANEQIVVAQTMQVNNPVLWSVENPVLYKAVTRVFVKKKVIDRYETEFGIRYFNFDVDRGFSLNGRSLKINGVCLHHDLGCLGSAFNTRAMERQLEIMRGMGVNAIRTSHNPPAPELLQLCDRMGFIVMDEMFDMWKIKKTEFDYSHDWDVWHKRDLEDFIKRDRNHPSVIIWSVGNEILEQWDTTGVRVTRELVGIVKSLDKTRPITTANNEVRKDINNLIKSDALDIIGFNYHHETFEPFPKDYPGKKFIATETVSSLATRGHYDMPSDSIRRWPIAWDKPFHEGNPDNTVSAYDNVSAPWGSTQEETWKIIKKHDYLSGQFIWTGFDYIGEPTPYGWPSRSSYFGIVDLAGFPKDTYYMYQSEWTNTPVLHVFPHWNWTPGKIVDVWAYYNQADEVELFLNGKSVGVRKKQGDELHVMWRLPFEAGTLKAVSRKNGKEVLVREIKTAGKPAKIVLEADRPVLHASGSDLSFVTVKVLDDQGNLVPYADNLITFTVTGNGTVAGVDNGDPMSHASFKASERKAFHGLCLLVVKGKAATGAIHIEAKADGLMPATLNVEVK